MGGINPPPIRPELSPCNQETQRLLFSSISKFFTTQSEIEELVILETDKIREFKKDLKPKLDSAKKNLNDSAQFMRMAVSTYNPCGGSLSVESVHSNYKKIQIKRFSELEKTLVKLEKILVSKQIEKALEGKELQKSLNFENDNSQFRILSVAYLNQLTKILNTLSEYVEVTNLK